MEKRWIQKNIDLKLLTKNIGQFFKEKKFEAVQGEIPTGFQILAANSPYFKIGRVVTVTIEGKPDNFTVKLELIEEKKAGKSSLRNIWLMQMIGAGFLITERLKSEEAWENLKREIWRHIENIIPYLTDSAESSS